LWIAAGKLTGEASALAIAHERIRLSMRSLGLTLSGKVTADQAAFHYLRPQGARARLPLSFTTPAQIRSINMGGLTGPTFGGPSSNDYGDITGNLQVLNQPGLLNEPLWNHATWSVTVGAGFPIQLAIDSNVFSSDPDFLPTLNVELSGDLAFATAAVPGPVMGAGLPGLVLMLGAILVRLRRRVGSAQEV
jgi:hypothetical protein